MKRSKNWKKRVFDFMMLFLAVFLGFIAENVRENFSDRQHASELAKSFYNELRDDSIAIASKVKGRIKKEQAIEYMVSFFRDSSLSTSSKMLSINFLWATTVRTPTIFTPRTVVLEQLKSSGSLRYFKSDKLQQLVGDLSIVIDYLEERQALEAKVFEEYIQPLVVNHMDYDFQYKLFSNGIFDRLSSYENSDENIPFRLSQIEKIDRQPIINALGFYHTNNLKSTRLVPFKEYIEINAEMLAELRHQYNLK
jgi:hypothetical protein